MTPEIESIVRASGQPEKAVRAVIRALAATIVRRERTEIRGLGAFTWRKYLGHPPGGGRFDTEHLWFTTRCLNEKRREQHGDQ